MPKSRRTLYLDDASFEQLQKLSPNISQEVDGFIRKRVEELTGKSIGEGVDYEGLRSKYSELVNRTARKDAQLKEKPCYHEANDLLAGLGLKKDFSNADELVPKFLAVWRGDVDFAEEYVTLVELAAEKRQAERRLREIRTRSKKEDPGAPKTEEQRKKEAELQKQREEAEEAQRRKTVFSDTVSSVVDARRASEIEDGASEGSCEEDDEEEDLDVKEDSDLENPAVSEHPQECREIVPVVSP